MMEVIKFLRSSPLNALRILVITSAVLPLEFHRHKAQPTYVAHYLKQAH